MGSGEVGLRVGASGGFRKMERPHDAGGLVWHNHVVYFLEIHYLVALYLMAPFKCPKVP